MEVARAKRSKTKFRVVGSFDRPRLQQATVTIERATLDPLFHLRVLRNKRVYTLPLSDVARIITQRIILAEVAAKKAERRKNRKRR